MSAVRRRRRLAHAGVLSLALAGTTTAWRAAPVANTQGPPVWAMSTDESTSAACSPRCPRASRSGSSCSTARGATSSRRAWRTRRGGTGAFAVFPLPSRGALVRHLAIDPRTRDVWVAYGVSPGPPARIARLSVGRAR